MAERPAKASTTPFGPRLHALVLYFEVFQALSYGGVATAFQNVAELARHRVGVHQVHGWRDRQTHSQLRLLCRAARCRSGPRPPTPALCHAVLLSA